MSFKKDKNTYIIIVTTQILITNHHGEICNNTTSVQVPNFSTGRVNDLSFNSVSQKQMFIVNKFPNNNISNNSYNNINWDGDSVIFTLSTIDNIDHGKHHYHGKHYNLS